MSFAKCPICADVDTKYYICRNGHNICGVCFDQLPAKDCPTCRGGYNNPPTRNLIVEDYVLDPNNGLVTPCRNKANGCNFAGTTKTLPLHRDCEFFKVPCPDSDCNQRVVLKHLNQHLKDKHKDVFYETLDASNGFYSGLSLKPNFADHSNWALELFSFDGQTFYLRRTMNQRTKEMCIWMFIDSKQLANRYKVEITVTGPDSNKIQFTGGVFSLDTPVETIFESDDCISLPFKQIRQMRTGYAGSDQRYSHKLDMDYKMIKM